MSAQGGSSAATQRFGFIRLPSRISMQLQLMLGGAVLLTLAASLVGWFSFNRVDDAQNEVNDRSLPEITAAFNVAETAGVLVAAAPRLTTADSTGFADVVVDINETHEAFEQELAALEALGSEEERLARIREHADTLVANIDTIESEMPSFFSLEARSAVLLGDLTAVQNELNGIVVPALDDQFFYLMTGYTSIDQPPASAEDYFSNDQLFEYRRLSELQGDLGAAAQLLANAFTVGEPELVEPLRGRFEASFAAFRGQASAFIGVTPELLAQLRPLADQLYELGQGEQGGFALAEQELIAAERQSELLASNRTIAVDLVEEVHGLVGAANANAEAATLSSSQSIRAGRTLLVVIGLLSVAGALLIDWLFVWRLLLRRLDALSSRMRRMAGGELEEEVVVSGRDEVADMAAALEVFRRNALEVQRLNLVEHLAEELREKNGELESALSDLDKAQGQIVMREKLAALGELTAGVAHEIRNPLNFINNFSAASSELLQELKEALEDSGVQISDDQKEYIEEISTDLIGNLERIRSHGDRANRIVQDMLTMSRGGGGEARPVDLNSIVVEHSMLAYHSARALDPEFQLTVQQDLDPDAGEIEAIPGDLGRVFLNMVNNACYAVDEKRRRLVEEGSEQFMPQVLLTTKRTEDTVTVRIRDNGSGIPQEAIDKIFNPFFTTKPTDRGTGLGLALSNDIVRQHGGTISVESEPGEFTEMTVTLPITQAAALASSLEDNAATDAANEPVADDATADDDDADDDDTLASEETEAQPDTEPDGDETET